MFGIGGIMRRKKWTKKNDKILSDFISKHGAKFLIVMSHKEVKDVSRVPIIPVENINDFILEHGGVSPSFDSFVRRLFNARPGFGILVVKSTGLTKAAIEAAVGIRQVEIYVPSENIVLNKAT